ncbi:hypothetical protein [Chitinophaga sp. sic0106]|uniref:hypothetical protein n=1 Tax=Chitinophaga sp. sic0106 TaxID=2854785 RepID=UPI001C45B6FB|nr:hypothetical protein [Chitinophaga sp. sic0106]MBV7530835.1 hypothetical protein [Chitinophaga sp. sic0106]
MIEITELSAGNYVTHANAVDSMPICRVHSIDLQSNTVMINPIGGSDFKEYKTAELMPLAFDNGWLKRFGFTLRNGWLVNNDGYYLKLQQDGDTKKFQLFIKNPEELLQEGPGFQYVHQFQNILKNRSWPLDYEVNNEHSMLLTIDELQNGNLVDYHGYPAIIDGKHGNRVTLRGLGTFNIDPGPNTLLTNIAGYRATGTILDHLEFRKQEYMNGDITYVKDNVKVELLKGGVTQEIYLHTIQNEYYETVGQRLQMDLLYQIIFRPRQ